MRLVGLAIAATLAGPAAAAPVAEGYELTQDSGYGLWVAKGKRRAPLGYFGLTDLDLKVDKRARTVAIPVLTTCDGDQTITFTFDQLESRLLNAEALVLHRQKDWAVAARGFAAAGRLDPTWRFPAYNQASALTLAGDPAGAVAALAPWLASEPIATYVQVTRDPELAPLLATKELAAIRAPKPGMVTVTAAGLEGTYGYVADRKLVAAQIDESNGMSCDTRTSIALIDAARAVELARLPLSTVDHCTAGAKPVLRDPNAAARIAKLLVELGVTPTPSEHAFAADQSSDGKRVVRLPTSKLGVVTGDSGTHILRGSTTLAPAPLSQSRLTWAAFLPDAKLMLIGSYRPNDSCPINGLDAIAIK
jgi:hypothetical protein